MSRPPDSGWITDRAIEGAACTLEGVRNAEQASHDTTDGHTTIGGHATLGATHGSESPLAPERGAGSGQAATVSSMHWQQPSLPTRCRGVLDASHESRSATARCPMMAP
jgi:hypothetical protein